MKIAASLLAMFVMAAVAQEDTTTRQLWNTEFGKKRPAGPDARAAGRAA